MSIYYGDTIYQKLLTDFAALNFEEGGGLFTGVSSWYTGFDQPEYSCVLLPDTPDYTVLGANDDRRVYGFIATVPAFLEAATDATEGSDKVSKLLHMYDRQVDYLSKIPNNLGTLTDKNANDFQVLKVDISNPAFGLRDGVGGVELLLVIRFNVSVLVDPRAN
jgi:hypothetical protein